MVIIQILVSFVLLLIGHPINLLPYQYRRYLLIMGFTFISTMGVFSWGLFVWRDFMWSRADANILQVIDACEFTSIADPIIRPDQKPVRKSLTSVTWVCSDREVALALGLKGYNAVEISHIAIVNFRDENDSLILTRLYLWPEDLPVQKRISVAFSQSAPKQITVARSLDSRIKDFGFQLLLMAVILFIYRRFSNYLRQLPMPASKHSYLRYTEFKSFWPGG